MENLLFVSLIAGAVVVAMIMARRSGRPTAGRGYDHDVGSGIEPHGDGGPTPGGSYDTGGGDGGGGGGS
jgi:hypothetical protein